MKVDIDTALQFQTDVLEKPEFPCMAMGGGPKFPRPHPLQDMVELKDF